MSAIADDLFPRHKLPNWTWLLPIVLGLLMAMGLFVSKTKSSQSDPCPAGNVINAASASVTDVNTAIGSASNGDCIVMPASASSNWSATFVSTSKGITIDCNGSTITRTGASDTPLFTITAHATFNFRLTNCTFLQSDGTGGMSDQIKNVITISGGQSDAKFRLDHLAVTMTDTAESAVFMTIYAWGLIDHSTFTAPDNSEMLHLRPATNGNYTDTITPGSQDAVYVEDCTFTNNGTGNGNSAIQMYDMGRYVARKNVFNQTQVDVHGTANEVGGRWAEIYDNDFDNPAGAKASDKTADLRAGSGVAFDNRCSGNCEPIYFREEDAGTWPRAYQIGSGYNGHTDGHSTCAVARGTLSNPSNTAPFYTWNNEMDVQTHSENTTVLEGRDWIDFVSQPADIYQMNSSGDTCSSHYSYTALTYPHPLIGSF